MSPDAYQAEVVWFLQWEEEKRGPRTRVEAVAEKASSACTVSEWHALAPVQSTTQSEPEPHVIDVV